MYDKGRKIVDEDQNLMSNSQIVYDKVRKQIVDVNQNLMSNSQIVYDKERKIVDVNQNLMSNSQIVCDKIRKQIVDENQNLITISQIVHDRERKIVDVNQNLISNNQIVNDNKTKFDGNDQIVVNNISNNITGNKRMINLYKNNIRYLIDSGASGHLTPWKEHLLNYISIKGIVRYPDGTTSNYYGYGDFYGIKNVYYVPDIEEGIISVPELDDLGWIGESGNGKYNLTDSGGDIRIRGKKRDRLYYIESIKPIYFSKNYNNIGRQQKS